MNTEDDDNLAKPTIDADEATNAAVAALSQEELDFYYEQVGDLVFNPDWNLEAHIAGNTDDQGVFRPPSYSEPTPTVPYDDEPKDSAKPIPEPPSDEREEENQLSSKMSEAVAALSEAQRQDLYAQVGDLIYNKDWNLAAHIAGNISNGVFTAPSYELGLNAPNENASLDWASLAEELDLDLSPWESLDEFDRNVLGDAVNYIRGEIATEVKALSEEFKDDLFQQVGKAMYAPGFNLAAHIAANTKNGVFIAPGLDDSATASEGIDWLEFAQQQGLEIANYEYEFIELDAWDQPTQIRLPDIGSDAWVALLDETGGAAANEGFDYLAHIAATTSQTLLPGLSEDEVKQLIVETGVTNFIDFDIQAHHQQKLQATDLSSKLLSAKKINVTAEEILVGSKKNDRMDFSKSKIEKKLIATGDGDDIVIASKGDNIIVAGTGNDQIDGGDGTDAVVINAQRAEAEIQYNKLTDRWIVASENDGVDTLENVERIVLQDQAIALDLDGNAGKSYRIYKAAFDRDPMSGDTSGLGYWINQSDDGMDLVDISARFIDSNEFRSLYGDAPTDGEFISALYKNVLDRTPDQAGYEWWVEQLATNPEKSWEKVLADFSESAENVENVEELIANGIAYDIFVG